MFLKKLESVGFKSFAERISVDFVPGVTAVVGPNGSGKSNVTDAIRWVLGEQSAKSLRGTKMEDIIFQGSDTRKPLNVAEVTLVLDNQARTLPVDYQEVSVTRRVYRSGESEFYLNKQSCRLKDIIDLFMDSGLGREAFSIISQGKVEEILSSKAEERRTIFEEAAGVLKYKNRKKKAEYKLAETQENLNRVEDIIYEIEGQLEPLQQQASIAKEYLTQKELLTNTEIALLHAEILELHSEWSHYLKNIDQLKQDDTTITSTIQKKSALIEEEQVKIQRLDQAIEGLQQQLLSLTEELEKLTGNKNLLIERTKNVTNNKQKLAQELATIDETITEHANLSEKEQEELFALQSIKKKTEEALNECKNKLDVSVEDMEAQIELLKSDYIELLNEQAANRNAQQSIEQQLSQLEQRKNNQQHKLDLQRKERNQLAQELESLQAEQEEQVQLFEAKEQKRKQIQQHLLDQENEIQAMQAKLQQGYQYLEKIKSRKEMLEEMKEDFQGFFYGVKAVLKARDDHKLTGVHGAVIELLQVPDQYVSALETALGGQAQHIVVDDEKTARQAIHYLKQSNNGRATFLPLQTMRAKNVPSALLTRIKDIDGFVGVASDLIEYDQKYHVIVSNLLGTTILAKTLKDANELASLLERRYRIVTLDGDVVNPGGSMSGGAKKNTNQSLFTREKDLKEITDKLADTEKRTSLYEEKLSSKKAKVAELQKDLARQTEQHTKLKEKQIDLQSRIAEVTINLRHHDDHMRIYDQDNVQVDQDRKTLIQSKQEKEQALEELKRQVIDLQAQIEYLTKEKENKEKNKDSIQQQYHQLQVQLAQQTTKVENQTDKTAQLRSRLEELQATKAKLSKELEELAQLEQSQRTISDVDHEIEQKQGEKQQTLAAIQDYRNQRLDLTTWLSTAESEVKTVQNQRQALREKLQSYEVKANRLDVELENRLDHLQTEYEISFEKVKETYPKAENIKESRQQVKLIKRTIDELGTVNLGAIDEYERIAERYQFLTDQQTDLVSAKATLYDVIAEMDEEMERRFDETFSQIKEEFSIVFQQLFGGGHAALTLTDPSNLLSTGVEIKAQPPGKKAQQLALLSGGERALTAIALLFAILRVRPVPFCVLDEVEAALDEANVNRFANYLKDYSEKTQFIVITHRQGTMEGADVLYGVTMQESGVSRFVSVKLEETKELLKS
ncbi:chromosome segregation protein [Natronobacillus azotifigens]|uniref:Chromosome partition protein Smc n=1 Tax=Natronobacillus azotifigens TaxID=472978 RepID=A0A9J6RCX4_9BACI|nr:chromosome segregation protein SMC [Natronobacillus azotifigens]MCZ0703399.1 chromosome segregation protein SMC [Natronobacillus azotifigens]